MPNATNNGGRKRYTAAQRRAYYLGIGYGACNDGKAIPLTSEDEKESFRNGLKKAQAVSPSYPNRRGGKK